MRFGQEKAPLPGEDQKGNVHCEAKVEDVVVA